jgi:elongator complex protein 2
LANKNVFEFIVGVDIELESVLLGHTESVNDLKWCQGRLVSASADCSVLIWEELEGAWVTTSRFGQLYGNKNAFLGVEVSEDGSEIFAHTVTGALLEWRKKEVSPKVCIFADPNSQQKMQSECLISGHYKRVTGLSWGSSGTYLASCSQDQTTRIFCRSQSRWVEIARAQIHGYDLNTIQMLPVKEGCPDMLVCGGDEKVVRLLEPLAHFCNFHNIFSGKTLHHTSEKAQEFTACESPLIYQVGSESSQEVLGLMTKATGRTNFYVEPEEEGDEAKETEKQFRQVDYASNFVALAHPNPKAPETPASDFKTSRIGSPTEDILVSTTLWPEVNKLYGHGYEISAVATNRDGTVLVSASKSLTKENAALIFWDLKNFKVDYSVPLHSSTVLDIQFMGDKLLTTGRDRVLCLWERDIAGRFQPKYHKSAHAKIVYGLAVGFGESMRLFATASRDHTVKLWALGGQGFEEKDVLNVGEEAHSIEFIQEALFCVGLLSGRLCLVQVDPIVGKLALLSTPPTWFNHGRCVNRITRNPLNNGEFATCGDDNTVRFFEVNK